MKQGNWRRERDKNLLATCPRAYCLEELRPWCFSASCVIPQGRAGWIWNPGHTPLLYPSRMCLKGEDPFLLKKETHKGKSALVLLHWDHGAARRLPPSGTEKKTTISHRDSFYTSFNPNLNDLQCTPKWTAQLQCMELHEITFVFLVLFFFPQKCVIFPSLFIPVSTLCF